MDWWRPDLFFPILGAIAAGGLIGFEREFRGHPAGLRTHILVSLASALLMLAAVHQLSWMNVDNPAAVVRIDPVRMAHGILTGVGFLCGGVIFRHGFSVHGLTTAASLWITSALGTLFGMQVYDLAVAGAVVTVLVLSGLRFVDKHVPQMRAVHLRVRSGRDAPLDEAALREALKAFGLTTTVIDHRLHADGSVELSGTFHALGRVPASEVSAAMLADPRVASFELRPRRS